MVEVGSSISLTTITTLLAFALGYTSSIPAIKWLCLYAFLAIFLVFIFQLTLFVGCLVIDEARVKSNRLDVCCCFKAKSQESIDADERTCEQEPSRTIEKGNSIDDDHTEALPLSFMGWYVHFLMRPLVKAVVVTIFLCYLGICVYSATQLTQEFIISEFLPQGSYASNFLNAVDDYATEMVPLGIYFRNMDQSDPKVQQEMREYIGDLMKLNQLDRSPPFCWVTDFGNETDQLVKEQLGIDISQLSFNQKLDLALSDRRIKQVYGDDIVRDEDGNIISSRCWVYLRNVDFDVVQSQIAMLNDQRAVSAAQPVNQGEEHWKMFTFADLYFLWEFYSIAVKELTSTTIAGVVSVAIIAFLLIPHWTAVFFVLPMIIMLYVDMLGK